MTDGMLPLVCGFLKLFFYLNYFFKDKNKG